MPRQHPTRSPAQPCPTAPAGPEPAHPGAVGTARGADAQPKAQERRERGSAPGQARRPGRLPVVGTSQPPAAGSPPAGQAALQVPDLAVPLHGSRSLCGWRRRTTERLRATRDLASLFTPPGPGGRRTGGGAAPGAAGSGDGGPGPVEPAGTQRREERASSHAALPGPTHC